MFAAGICHGLLTQTRRRETRGRRWRSGELTLRLRKNTSPSSMPPDTRALSPTWLVERHKLTWQSWWDEHGQSAFMSTWWAKSAFYRHLDISNEVLLRWLVNDTSGDEFLPQKGDKSAWKLLDHIWSKTRSQLVNLFVTNLFSSRWPFWFLSGHICKKGRVWDGLWERWTDKGTRHAGQNGRRQASHRPDQQDGWPHCELEPRKVKWAWMLMLN